MLGLPYGWGCVPGQADCSGFMQSIFDTVGITLPRNTYEQCQIGRPIRGFDEEASSGEKAALLLRKGVGGITTIWLKGHIMLYLGEYKERPYVIHATYGYGETSRAGVVHRIIKKVVVSDMSLGEGSPKGSLLDRALSARVLDNGEGNRT